MDTASSSTWTKTQDKQFENALAVHYEESDPDMWEKVAKAVPGKTVEEVKIHYQKLVEDIELIESGQIPLPDYK